MKKQILAIIIVLFFSAYIFCNNSAGRLPNCHLTVTEYPPNAFRDSSFNYEPVSAPVLTDSTYIELYEYYAFGPDPERLILVHFRPDHIIEFCNPNSNSIDGSNRIGHWRVSNDSVFIYEDNYFTPGEGFIGEPKGIVLWDNADSYRCLFDNYDLTDAEIGFPVNVDVFTIELFGHILVSADQFSPKYNNGYISHYAFYAASKSYLDEDYITVSRHFGPFRPLFIKEPRPINTAYTIADKTILAETTSKVTLLQDSIRYNIVRSAKYLPGRGLNLYDPAAEKALTDWMDTVQIGRTYHFELQRPAYPTDSATHNKFLEYADSVYISRGNTLREAYGYFFARIIPDIIRGYYHKFN